ncbi:unnamed protein product [Arabidopsis lyrata]|nr:unnamed protein product [Arabidopsis lyrata]
MGSGQSLKRLGLNSREAHCLLLKSTSWGANCWGRIPSPSTEPDCGHLRELLKIPRGNVLITSVKQAVHLGATCRSPRGPHVNSQPEPALQPPEPVHAKIPEPLPSVYPRPSLRVTRTSRLGYLSRSFLCTRADCISSPGRGIRHHPRQRLSKYFPSKCYRLGFGGKTLVSRPDRGFCSQTGSKGEKAVTEYRKIYALSPVGVVLYSAFCVWAMYEINKGKKKDGYRFRSK